MNQANCSTVDFRFEYQLCKLNKLIKKTNETAKNRLKVLRTLCAILKKSLILSILNVLRTNNPFLLRKHEFFGVFLK